MAKIVLAPYGSLGDLHPFLAIGFELRERGHQVLVTTLEPYREKIQSLGFEFRPLRPEFDPEDRDSARRVMDTRRGSEVLITEYMLPNIRAMYEDLMSSVKDADLLIAGEIVFPAHSVAEKEGLKLVTTTLAPLSMFSAYEPNVYPNVPYLRYLNFLGRPFQEFVIFIMKRVVRKWLEDYREFRRSIGLDPTHDPIVEGKYSKDLHLAMFSSALGGPQPDWNEKALQTGFCFYDGRRDLGAMPERLLEFLDVGDPPIVFTLGSAAVMDAGDFFEESIAAAKRLERRAVCLYGIFNEKPRGFDADRVGFDYAPFGELFPRAACVVHQGGVGTTAQALKAGVPQLIVPYSHDQPDNAARCVRNGVARTIGRAHYKASTAAREIAAILSDESYQAKAAGMKRIIDSENGTMTASDAIESTLQDRA
ncbi:MAG: glycosyltransferase [Acidobacteriota bacterium]|nr:glycosyltransferase [Acidobacteriota bacterium]